MSNHPIILHDVSTLTDQDVYLFKEGNHFRLYEKLGSHRMTVAGQKGIHFAVWAPNAEGVSVTGDFNEWVIRYNYRVGVPRGGYWKEMLNSDTGEYGGSGQGNLGGVEATPVPCHGREHSLSLIIPPLGILFFKNEGHHRVLQEN